MAKKKTKDTKGLAGIVNKVPREIDINGQLHMLAWITPKEGRTLKDLGGSGETGPMGIPQYSYGDGDFGQDDPDSDATAGAGPSVGPSGGRDDDNDDETGGDIFDEKFTAAELAAGQAARDAIAAHNAAVKAGVRPGEDRTDYTPQFGPNVANAMAQAEQNRLAQQVAQSYFDYSNIFAPSVYSSKRIGGDFFGGLKSRSLDKMRGVPSYSSWFAPGTEARKAFANMALDQLRSPNPFTGQTRMENAKSVLGGLFSIPGTKNLEDMIEDLEKGGRPVLDASGKVQGVFSEGAFGEVYQGNPVEGLPETGWTPYDTQGGYDDTKRKRTTVVSVTDAKVSAVPTSPPSYYGQGVGTATTNLYDPTKIDPYLASLYGITPSPIGATYDAATSSYSMPGSKKNAKSRTRLRGLDIFKPVSTVS